MNALRIVVGVVAVVLVGCSSSPPMCPAGQVLKDGACIAEVTCGTGTVAMNGLCVSTVIPVTCGAGTTAMNGTCVPDLVCGAGTRPMNGVCVPICASGTMSTDGGCVPDVVCGTGTTAMNGMCVPNVQCGTGTVAAGGSCVPDGTVVCTQGTRFDMTSGTCVVDPTACANGTTLVGTVCTPDDQLLMGAADVVEVEATDGGTVSGVLPAAMLDAGVTFYGCVTPSPTERDDDVWTLTVTEPTLLDVRVDGIGGLSGAFVVVPVSNPQLVRFQRVGVNLTADTSQREVYLPLAGTYAIYIDDARALLTGAPTGSANTCYFATVSRKPMPAALLAMVIPQQLADDGHVRVLTITAGTDGEIHDVLASSNNPALIPAFTLLKDGVFVRSVSDQTNGAGAPAHASVGGLAMGGVTTIVLDAELNYGLAPIDFRFDPAVIAAQPLPTSGGNASFTHLTAGGATPWRSFRYFFFDVSSPGIVNFNVAGSVPLDMVLAHGNPLNPDSSVNEFVLIDDFGSPGRASFLNEPVRFATAGRYYFVVYDPAAPADGTMHTLSGTLTPLTTAPATFGMQMSNVPLPQTGSAFLSLDMTNPVWVEYGITATTNWGIAPVFMSVYPANAEGWLRIGVSTGGPGSVLPQFTTSVPAAGGARGRIHAGETADDFLIRVSGASGPGIDFSLLIRNRPNVVDLGTIPPGSPVVNNQTGLTNGTPLRFIARGAQGNALRAVVTPVNAMSDLRVERLDANEVSTLTVDAALIGGAETLAASFGASPNWIAWTVANKTVGVPTDISSTLTATAPRPYVITTGALPFVDACTGMGSSVLGTAQDDELFTGQTFPMPFTMFRFFGEVPPTTHRVGANGWISFDTASVSFGAFQNLAIPTGAAPNGVIAPYWDDQDQSTMCRKVDPSGTLVTYQWTAQLYQQPGRNVQYQVVFHADGVIDFIYGPNHLETGGSATVGLEDLNGLFGHQVVFNQAGSIAPNTSRTFTPM